MKKRILVVEDHADTRRGLERFLEVIGYDLVVADSVRSAQKLAKKNVFDVMLIDLNLPDGTGWDLLKGLNKKKQVPAVAMSGWSSEKDVAKSKEAGFLAHLVKPIIPEELVEALGQAIALSGENKTETKRTRNKRIARGDAGSDWFAV
jgi:DNA-binding response OmpR family regulator